MPKNMTIQSSRGLYQLQSTDSVFAELAKYPEHETQYIVDKNVYELYQKSLSEFLPGRHFLVIEAIEVHKNVEKISAYVEALMKNGVKINHRLVAIGGGIIQDITCFLASTLFRGMTWDFAPTTLLAQADSCIGSKSSMNVGVFKNLMGTFYPPQKILWDISFLKTLAPTEIRSGIGEILKVHMIHGQESFEKLANEFAQLEKNPSHLQEAVWNGLQYKKTMIELDEFDQGPRNVMNYGHSYGHAIETATMYAIPHGIAVTIGMDMANFQSLKMNRISESQFQRWHQVLFRNYQDFSNTQIDLELFIGALTKDKKNKGSDLALILVRNGGPIEKVRVANDLNFKQTCQTYFTEVIRSSGKK